MGLLTPFLPGRANTETRYSWQQYVNDVMMFEGNRYRLHVAGSKPDVPDANFEGYVERLHKNTSIVSAAAHQRALLVSQAVPKWQRLSDGELFGTRDLSLFNDPAGMSANEFFYRLELDATYAGSAYVVNDGGRARRLRPDRCTVVLASQFDPEWDGETDVSVPFDAEVRGLLYQPSHDGRGPMQVFMPGEFIIWAPEPDPIYFWRGMSWVSSVVQEVVADGQATDHQQKFFENAATPSVVAIMDPTKSPQETEAYAKVFNDKFSGHRNAFKAWFLGGGTDVRVIGSTLDSLNLKDLTGGFENRVAVRSRVPNVILGGREGLSGSSLNAGNYDSARRMLADGWLAPHLDGLMAALSGLLPAQAGARLSWDRAAVLFMQEDVHQQAEIMSTKAGVIRTLIDGGFDPVSVVTAVDRGHLGMLEHSGKLSVQLQSPDQGTFDEDDDRSSVTRAAIEEPRPEQMRLELHNHTHVTRSDVTVEPAQVTVEGARVEAPHIDVHVPEVRAEAPVVQVNVDPTPVNITNEIDVEPTPVEVRNQVDVDTPPAQVTVVGDDRKSKFKVRRDGQGRISEVDEA